ncbi:MAG: hypothetical protein MJ002_00245 [Paludibacteraceae bacterium]|nr:hypothetical protein [Paludibacteraceae bacterium]
MKKVIVTHATKSQEEIVEMNWQERFQNPAPYHHIVNRDRTIRKGRADREVCDACSFISCFNFMTERFSSAVRWI